MNTYYNYKFATLICCAFMAVGCGKSSNDNTAPVLPVDQQNQIQEEAEESNSFCLNNPSDSACFQGRQQAMGLGYEDYNNGQYQNGYVDSNFTNQSHSGGNQYANLCGCNPGTKPVVYEGSIVCADTVAHRGTNEVLHVGVSLRKKNGKTRSDFNLDYDYIEANSSDTAYTNPTGPNNCYQQAQAGCNPYGHNQCYGFKDRYGNPVQAICKKIPGYQYGKCEKIQHRPGHNYGSGYEAGNSYEDGY